MCNVPASSKYESQRWSEMQIENVKDKPVATRRGSGEAYMDLVNDQQTFLGTTPTLKTMSKEETPRSFVGFTLTTADSQAKWNLPYSKYI